MDPATLQVEYDSINSDEAHLARFGKRQQLKRSFRFFPIVALTCTVMITWEGFLVTFQTALLDGGPAGVVYGYIFVWIGSLLQALVMAEMGSMVPVAGGQYNWVASLSPPSTSKVLSYMTGWLTFIAWQATVAGACYISGTVIQGLIALNNPDYSIEGWQGTLLLYSIILLALIVNSCFGFLLPQLENVLLFIHIAGFFGILIPLVNFAPHNSPDDVFKQFINGGDWPTDGLSFFVGISGLVYAFVGIDVSAHMAEEIEGASRIIPYSMILGVIFNGMLGFGMMVTTLFCLGSVEDVLNSSSQYPVIEIFANAVKSRAGASAMVAVIIFMTAVSTIGCLTTASRMTWAFAREKGLPFHGFLSHVEPRSKIPINAIGLSVTISLLLGLINIGSAAAFSALTSLSIAGTYSTFALSACIMLHKRLTVPNDQIKWGPFCMGRLGVPITVASLIYTAIGFFFTFWPLVSDPDLVHMNWSSLVFGVTVLFSLFYWMIWGRRVYTGPVQEVALEDSTTVLTKT